MLVKYLGRAFGVKSCSFSSWELVLIFGALLLVSMNIIRSASDCRDYGGTDLRSRIVGARAVMGGIDPYTLSYSENLPPGLQDPLALHKGFSRCGTPPSLLMLFVPLTFLKYEVAYHLWTVLQWIAFFLTIAFLSRTLESQQNKKIFIIIAFSLFGGAYFWRLHLERGTYYVFTAMALSWGIMVMIQNSRDTWLQGIPFGVFAALRPTGLVLIPPLFLLGFRRTALACAFVLLALFGVSLWFGGIDIWRSFYDYLQETEKSIVDSSYLDRNYPYVGQGVRMTDDGSSASMLPSKSANISALSVLSALADRFPVRTNAIRPVKAVFPLMIKVLFVLFSLCLWMLFLFCQRTKKLEIRQRLFVIVFCAILADYLAPIRYSYVDLHLCILTALILHWLVTTSRWYLRAVFLLSLASEFWLYSNDQLATVVRSAGVMAVALVFLFHIWHSQRQQLAKRELS